MNTRLTFIAHAATEAQRLAAFPLDETIPERESARIAQLSVSFSDTATIWSAPEQRTIQTARMLKLDATIADSLRDCDYGRWRGQTMETVQSEDAEGIVSWLTDPGAAPHGGESIEQLTGRVSRWMEKQSSAIHTVAITHPAVIRAALVHALGLPAPSFWRFDIAPFTLTDLRRNGSVWTLRCAACALDKHPR